MPNTLKIRAALPDLDWLVMGEVYDTETASFWRQPGVDSKKVKTEVFLLPSCQRGEKDCTTSNSGRWHQWHHKGLEPAGQSKSMGWMIVEIMKRRAMIDSGPVLTRCFMHILLMHCDTDMVHESEIAFDSVLMVP